MIDERLGISPLRRCLSAAIASESFVSAIMRNGGVPDVFEALRAERMKRSAVAPEDLKPLNISFEEICMPDEANLGTTATRIGTQPIKQTRYLREASSPYGLLSEDVIIDAIVNETPESKRLVEHAFPNVLFTIDPDGVLMCKSRDGQPIDVRVVG